MMSSVARNVNYLNKYYGPYKNSFIGPYNRIWICVPLEGDPPIDTI